MAVVIGYGTQILGTFFPGPDGGKTICAVSAQWATEPNIQRMYCLGGGVTPAIMVAKPTQTFSVTLYSEDSSGIAQILIPPSESCDDIVDIYQAGLSVVVCGAEAGDFIYDDWALQQFQYSKEEAQTVGQETWSFVRWMSQEDIDNPDMRVLAPTYVIRGIPEGQATIPDDILGVVFQENTVIQGSSGSVQGGQLGKYYETKNGVITAVGGVTATSGQTGNSSCSIPLMPLWI